MNRKKNKIYDEDYIDLFEILSTLWKGKNFIIKISLLFSLIGIIYSFSLENIYTASSTFYPHFEKNNLSQGQSLKNLAGLAGIDIQSESSSNIPPTLYPNIISSPQFKIEVLNKKINLNGSELSYREYLIKKEEKSNFKKILNLSINLFSNISSKSDSVSNNNSINILKISKEEYKLHEYLSKVILIELNDDEGFIKLSVKDSNPIVASLIAKISNEILQRKIIDFKLKNISDTYQFISSQLNIAKQNFYLLQDSLAIFNDKNRNIKSDLYRNQFSRIESEYLISKNIYNDLALSKEKTAIEVKKNTPIFTIINPVVIPNNKSEPQRFLIIISFTLSGFIFISLFLLIRKKSYQIWKKVSS
tara:strand:- start:25391 stop:26473 length:1083 start_codon:yes stop_codon:yes gene_type:complete